MDIGSMPLFSALANETRLSCLVLLMPYDELCVCEMTHAIGAAQPLISRHLSQLRGLDLVVDRRDGLWVHYRINPSDSCVGARGAGRDSLWPGKPDILQVKKYR